jgi:acyl-CoA thioesterase
MYGSLMSDLEAALALRTGDTGWTAFADPRYESINAMFGGWTAAIALAGTLEGAASDALPSAITVNFVDRVEPGSQVHTRSRCVGSTRSVGHWLTELLSSDGRTLAIAMVVLSNRRQTDGHTQPSMPDAPDPETLEEFHPPGRQGERTMIRPVTGQPPHGRRDTTSSAWVRDETGRPVDHLQLAFLADAMAPRPFFWSDGPRPSATLCMSVYFHANADEIAAVGDDYIFNEATGSRGESSTSGQHARLWSRSGVLLATTEQLHWYR